MATKILIVEDDANLLETLKYNMLKEGYETVAAVDGVQALEAARRETPDLIILDIMLPKMSGFEVCRILRKEVTTPILMLTARDDEVDKVVGLDMGADDYMTKPFSMRELVARIRAILRRRDEVERDRNETVSVGPFLIAEHEHRVEVDGKAVPLTPTEFKMFLALASNPERVFSRRELIDATQGDFFEGYERTVDAHIGNIRRKTAEYYDGVIVIETVYGVGYRFQVEEKT